MDLIDKAEEHFRIQAIVDIVSHLEETLEGKSTRLLYMIPKAVVTMIADFLKEIGRASCRERV